jgi:hypothetical protein
MEHFGEHFGNLKEHHENLVGTTKSKKIKVVHKLTFESYPQKKSKLALAETWNQKFGIVRPKNQPLVKEI